MPGEQFAWKLEAKCFNDKFIQEQLAAVRTEQGYDPFFPPKGSNPGEWAKRYCSDCPVKLACLAEAMKSLDMSNAQINHYDGIWGGLTAHGRGRLKKKTRDSARRLLEQMQEQFPDTYSPNEDALDDRESA